MLPLSACSGQEEGPDPSAVQTAENGDVFNGADVSFASGMIVHHAQALAMVGLADKRTGLSSDFTDLVDQIRDEQGPEIQTMTAWLTEWGKTVPPTDGSMPSGDPGDMPSMSGMDHGSMDHDSGDSAGDSMGGMSGMMTDEQMSELENATDEEFPSLWLQMMIDHHNGAIDMAETEVEDGRFEDAIDLAQNIADAQQDEVEQMQGMLDGAN